MVPSPHLGSSRVQGLGSEPVWSDWGRLGSTPVEAAAPLRVAAVGEGAAVGSSLPSLSLPWRAHPPLPLPTVLLAQAAPKALEPGTGDGRCQQMTERTLCVLLPLTGPAAHRGLAVGMWLQQEALVPVCASGDLSALPPGPPKEACSVAQGCAGPCGTAAAAAQVPPQPQGLQGEGALETWQNPPLPQDAGPQPGRSLLPTRRAEVWAGLSEKGREWAPSSSREGLPSRGAPRALEAALQGCLGNLFAHGE